MKFKENAIKPGMAIHCPTEENKIALSQYLMTRADLDFVYTRHKDGVGYFFYVCNAEENPGYAENDEITEFSDLVEPDDSPNDSPTDSSMTAAEVLEWFKHLYQSDDYNNAFPDMPDGYGISDLFEKYSPQEIVDIITDYEAAKKEPKPVEVEFLLICHVYEWWGDEWKEVKRVEHIVDGDCENEYEIAKQDLLDYRQSPQWRYECYVVSERRCRVKEDE